MKSCVTISLVPEVRGGPFVYWDDLAGSAAKARAIGFDAIEIFAPDSRTISGGGIADLLKQTGLKLAALGTGAGWIKHRLTLTSPQEEVRSDAARFVREMIDAASPFGASVIIGSMQGRAEPPLSRKEAIQLLAEELNDLGVYARGKGVQLLYEPLNRYETNLFNRVEEVVPLLKQISPNVRILADLFHMNIEETNIAEAVRKAGGFIGHVHFVDSNRHPAGAGHIDYAPVINALREIDFKGYLSAECHPFPDSDLAAAKTMETFKSFVYR